jgi:hypothetical protein
LWPSMAWLSLAWVHRRTPDDCSVAPFVEDATTQFLTTDSSVAGYHNERFGGTKLWLTGFGKSGFGSKVATLHICIVGSLRQRLPPRVRDPHRRDFDLAQARDHALGRRGREAGRA